METEANFLEKTAVRALLIAEKLLEERPPAPIELLKKERRSHVTRTLASWGFIVSVFVGSGIGLVELSKIRLQEKKQAQAEIIFGDSKNWQSRLESLSQLNSLIANPNFLLLENNQLSPQIYSFENLYFTQMSDQAKIVINHQAIRNWLAAEKYTTVQGLAFTFINKQDENKFNEISTFKIPVDSRFNKYILGSSPKEYKDNLSADLSSIITLSIELCHQIGAEEASKLSSTGGNVYLEERLKWYRDQFLQQKLPLFVIVADINPSLMKAKFLQ